jgi:hypothetical protein
MGFVPSENIFIIRDPIQLLGLGITNTCLNARTKKSILKKMETKKIPSYIIYLGVLAIHPLALIPSKLATYALFAWLISHQPAVLFSHNKPATSNQPAVLFSQNKPAPAISHQPTEQADNGEKIPTHPHPPKL